MHEELALCSTDASQGPSTVRGRQKQDLGVFGAQKPAGRDEQLPHREPELRRSLRGPHRLVEKFHVLTLLPLFHVTAEGGDAGRDRNHEEDHGQRANLEKLDDGKGE